MGSNHNHSALLEHGEGDAHHHHQHHYTQSHIMAWALLLTGGFALVEFFTGMVSGSLALISDAGHMVTDTAALGLAYFAQKMASRPASPKLSFGYMRIETIAAFINGLTMAAVALWIIISAVLRLWHPVAVDGGTVTWVASLGLLINIFVAWLLHKDQSSVNARAALVHVMGDLLGSVAAIVAGVVISATDWLPIDPLLSILVSLLIAKSTWGILKDSAWQLMDGVPHTVDYVAVGEALHELDGIASVHDLHIWDMSANQPTLMGHVMLEPNVEWPTLLDTARAMLHKRFDIEHITLQPEWKMDALCAADLSQNRAQPHTH